MKKIVINADDYGICPDVNNGIIKAYTSGAVTDFSFMIDSGTFYDAASLLNKNSINKCGIHLNLTSGSSLINNKKYPVLSRLLIDLMLRKVSIKDLIKEIDFQINTLLNSDIEITHIDSHQNIHLIPFLFEHIINYIHTHNMKVPVRVPREQIAYSRSLTAGNFFRLNILKGLSLFSRKYYNPPVQVVGQKFFNNKNKTDVLDEILEVIQMSKMEIFEFPVHPGYCNCDSSPICRDSYTRMREEELSFLLFNKNFFKERGIEQISFADII